MTTKRETYCELCNKEIKANCIKGEETYKVFGEDITISTEYLLCPECGNKIFDEELDSKTIAKAYAKYREKHNLLTPQDIKDIREKYSLSQNEFSNLLGWGEKTIFRYEKGSIQDNVHNDLLKFLQDEKNMLAYIKENSNRIQEKTKNKILKNMSNDINDSDILNEVYAYDPSIYSGFKRFDYNKASLMIQYFSERIDNLTLTKLLKLLNYSDNLFFKENSISISGIRYVHLQFGPVPERYKVLIDAMNNNGIIEEDIKLNNNYEEHLISKGIEKVKGQLSESELDVLNRVYEIFKNYNAKDISDYSHEEKGYKETIQGELISYEYSSDLSI